MSKNKTRQRLSDYYSFLDLVHLIRDQPSSRSDEFREMLDSVSDFIQSTSDRELRERSKEVEELLVKAIKMYENVLPPKRNVRTIGHDFRVLIKAEIDVKRFGIPNGWIQERFDTSQLQQFQDLPWHARIGIGVHVGNVSVEEVTLLSETFFLLVNARTSFDLLMRSAQHRGMKTSPHEHPDGYRIFSTLNSATCTYSRLGLINAAAFVETFVNSVGWNEVARRPNLTEQEKTELYGLQKNRRYLSLEQKIEKIPRIIRKDKRSPIILSDEKQRREPFISFLEETKQVRDASMHFAPGKAPIVRPPQEWLKLVESAVQHAVAVAREFWSACYPERPYPVYLASLDYDCLSREAHNRLTYIKSEMASIENFTTDERYV